jgi:hypothetical protein
MSALDKNWAGGCHFFANDRQFGRNGKAVACDDNGVASFDLFATTATTTVSSSTLST